MRLIISIITAVCILGAILVNATANEVIESPDEQKIICAETQSPECNDETEEQKEVAVHTHTAGEFVKVKEETCTEYGLEEQRCTECDELLDEREILPTGHEWSGVVTIQEASVFEDKIEKNYCTKCGEVSEEYTTSVNEIIAEEKACRGIYGRLFIPSVGCDVAVFYSDKNLQTIVDNADSAAMFDWYNYNTVIGDHAIQGFDVIKNVDIGTRAYIVTPNNIMTFECIDIIPNGINTGYELLYYDGLAVDEVYCGKYYMYTCNNDAEDTVTITLWDLV